MHYFMWNVFTAVEIRSWVGNYIPHEVMDAINSSMNYFDTDSATYNIFLVPLKIVYDEWR